MKKIILILILSAFPAFADEYNIHVIKVHDGDTFNAKINLGFNISIETNVRLSGINAPELSTGKKGKASTDRLKLLIEGKDVVLMTNPKREREKYGRILGYVMIGTTNINDLMVSEGLAVKFMESK